MSVILDICRRVSAMPRHHQRYIFLHFSGCLQKSLATCVNDGLLIDMSALLGLYHSGYCNNKSGIVQYAIIHTSEYF